MTNPFHIRHETGWEGAFTRSNADGAIPSGTPILKTNSEPGDATPDGTHGTVLGSMSHPDIMGGVILYFVEWAIRPRWAVGIMEFKVAEHPRRQA